MDCSIAEKEIKDLVEMFKLQLQTTVRIHKVPPSKFSPNLWEATNAATQFAIKNKIKPLNCNKE